MAVLAQDPRSEVSVPISDDEATRSLALTPNIGIEYLLIVLVVHVVDFAHVLVPEG